MTNTPTYMSDTDMRQLDKANYEHKIRMLEQKCMSERRDKLKLQSELLSAKVLLLETDMLTKLNLNKNIVGNHKIFMAELRERYSIPEGKSFGHDPISGEIKL